MSTVLFQKTMHWADENGEELMRKVWEPTPWIVNVYTGPGHPDRRNQDMLEWCDKNLGEASYPIHGREGVWHQGSATVNGWTWFGFATEEMMNRFLEAWPTPLSAGAQERRE